MKYLLVVLMLAMPILAQEGDTPGVTVGTGTTMSTTYHSPVMLSNSEIVKRFLRDGPKDFVNDGLSYEFKESVIEESQQVYSLSVRLEGEHRTIWDPYFQIWVYDGYDPREDALVYRVELRSIRKQ